VDSWAVDYGLINRKGELIEHPVCYRDRRTEGVMEQVFTQISRKEIFERTGIQFQVFNTLFQLYAHARAGFPDAAEKLLLIPDLIHYFLTGRAVSEYTNSTTTQLINARSRAWDREMMERLHLPSGLMAEIVPAGTGLSSLRKALDEELGLAGVRVVAPATHDTASAVAGAPLPDGWAYISSGTWSLVGVEREDAIINEQAERHNFTNEGGAFGSVRFLKNVMGLWILESCRREWQERGLDVNYDRLLGQVQQVEDPSGWIFPDDPRFFNPPSMLDAIAEQLRGSGQSMPKDPPLVARLILDSLAFRYGSVLRTIESLTNRKIRGVQIVGGGSQMDYLNQVTATITGLPVLAGPVEATVIGNVLVQAIAAGRFGSLSEARSHVTQAVRLKRFNPRPSSRWEEAARRYASIEARYSN
jgi:rhamnulokinase